MQFLFLALALLGATARPASTAHQHSLEAVMSSAVLSHVSKRYGRTEALHDVDLTFAPGVTGLLGPNGAGKTTLLRILATALTADGGEVRVLGADPTTPRGGWGCGGVWVTSRRRPAFPAGSRPSASSTTWRSSRSGPAADPRHLEVRRVIDGRPDRRRDQAGEVALGRSAPPGRPRPGAAGPTGPAGPRRTHGRSRPRPAGRLRDTLSRAASRPPS